jgi:hypothetical protein
MSKEHWGTFSVTDHCAYRAFVTDVMLYDRLVIPVPAKGKEAKWADEGWEPGKQEHLLKILGDRAVRVEWNDYTEERWAKRFEAGKSVGRDTEAWAMQYSRTELTKDLPSHVMGVEAVSAFQSIDELEKGLGMREVGAAANILLPPGAVTAILAHEFLVPDEPGWSHEDLLRAALDLSSEAQFRRKRANLWRWQWDYVDGQLVVTDRAAIESALEEMQELVAEERRELEKSRLLLASKYAFLIGSLTVAAMTIAAAPVALPAVATAGAGVFISVGQFSADRLLAPKQADEGRQAAAFLAGIERHFGWEDLLEHH